jgi:hypothetical protein
MIVFQILNILFRKNYIKLFTYVFSKKDFEFLLYQLKKFEVESSKGLKTKPKHELCRLENFSSPKVFYNF